LGNFGLEAVVKESLAAQAKVGNMPIIRAIGETKPAAEYALFFQNDPEMTQLAGFFLKRRVIARRKAL